MGRSEGGSSMTLQEMSHDYAASADAIGERIRQLH